MTRSSDEADDAEDCRLIPPPPPLIVLAGFAVPAAELFDVSFALQRTRLGLTGTGTPFDALAGGLEQVDDAGLDSRDRMNPGRVTVFVLSALRDATGSLDSSSLGLGARMKLPAGTSFLRTGPLVASSGLPAALPAAPSGALTPKRGLPGVGEGRKIFAPILHALVALLLLAATPDGALAGNSIWLSGGAVGSGARANSMRPFSTTMLGAGGRSTTPVGRRDLSGMEEARGEAGADRVPVSGWCWFRRLSTAATAGGGGGGLDGALARGGGEGCCCGGAPRREERRIGDVPVQARSGVGDRCGDGSLGRTFDLFQINHIEFNFTWYL